MKVQLPPETLERLEELSNGQQQQPNAEQAAAHKEKGKPRRKKSKKSPKSRGVTMSEPMTERFSECIVSDSHSNASSSDSVASAMSVGFDSVALDHEEACLLARHRHEEACLLARNRTAKNNIIKGLEGRLKDLEGRHKKALAQIKHQQKINTLVALGKDEAEEKVQELEKEIGDHERAADALRNRIGELEKEMRALKKEHETTTLQLKLDQANELESRMGELRMEKDEALKAERTLADGRVDKLHEELLLAKERAETLGKDLAVSDNKLDSLREKVAEITQQLKSEKNANDELARTNGSLTQRIEDLEKTAEENGRLHKENGQLNAENANLNKKIDDNRQTAIKEKTAAKQQAKRKAKEEESRLAKKQAEIFRLQKLLAEEQELRRDAEETEARTASNLTAANARVEKEKIRFTNMEKSFQKKSNDCKNLLVENRNLEDALKQMKRAHSDEIEKLFEAHAHKEGDWKAKEARHKAIKLDMSNLHRQNTLQMQRQRRSTLAHLPLPGMTEASNISSIEVTPEASDSSVDEGQLRAVEMH